MGNFISWTFVYLLKAIFVALFMGVGIAIGIALRKNKNRKLEKNQEE